jgi:exopolyphosphatase / guanosine-5'-triphosphate,3'-diphosphate pyrophosphatase
MTRSVGCSVARCACIDIGSNTTRLLVAENDAERLRELLAERAFTRLGSACDAHSEIGSHKIAEVAAIVARQVRLARELEVDSLRIVATAALRRTLNAPELARAIEVACGARMEILDAEEEARLAFAGAIGMLVRPPPGPVGVVDIGGGSTELVVGTVTAGVSWSTSLPVGSSVLTDTDLPSDPPTTAELAALRVKLATLFDGVDAPQPAAAYAVGGSATSLHRLVGAVLSHEALTRGLSALVSRPAAEAAPRLGLHAERARLLPAGILLLDAASRALGTPLELAGGGLREGVVLQQLARVDRT